jgi:hypothetical protein
MHFCAFFRENIVRHAARDFNDAGNSAAQAGARAIQHVHWM